MLIGNLEIYGIIYKIKNKINGKVYIGQTIQNGGFKTRYSRAGTCDIEKVYRFHNYKKNNNKTYNVHLLGAIEKYGFNSFEVNKTLDISFSREELNTKEKCWIQVYDSYENGYNKTLGGDGHGSGELNKEWKLNISKSLKGKSVSEETKSIISNTMSKTMICLNNLQPFNTIIEGENIFGISKFYISRCCRRELNFIRHPISKIPYAFLYHDDYLQMNNLEIKNIIKKFIINNTYKDVICLNTKETFNYIQLVESEYTPHSVRLACEGILKTTGRHPLTGEKLKWMYYDKYKEQQEII